MVIKIHKILKLIFSLDEMGYLLPKKFLSIDRSYYSNNSAIVHGYEMIDREGVENLYFV